MKKSWSTKLDHGLKNVFYKLGYFIGEYPGYFIIVPILICLLLGTGMQQLTYVNNPAYIFAPVNGEAQHERDIAEKLFPLNYSSTFDPSRLYRSGRFARLIVTAQDGGTLLTQQIWQEIKELDKIVRNLKIIFQDEQFEFDSLCARWNEECYGNEILELGDQMEEIEMGNLTLTYPIMFNYAWPLVFGGIEVFNETVKSVKALQLGYFINAQSPLRDAKGAKWEKALIETLDQADLTEHWKLIKIDRFMERTLSDQINENILAVVPYSIPTGILMVTFAILTCLMGDCVRSKPWLGVAGLVTSTLGTLSAFGVLCYCGVPFIGLNIAAPFLMMGIGMDDAYVVLSAWRQTSVHDSVPKRLGQAYADCAVSITITSLTDMLSFVIGIASPFVSIQIFSTYIATAVLTTYLFHIFFFGGAMALSGYHEAENCHSIFWWLKGTPKSKMDKLDPSKSGLLTVLFTGGFDPDDPDNPIDHKQHIVMLFFRNQWASFILRPRVKMSIVLLFFVYISIAIWGVTNTREGMELKRLASEGSYTKKFYDINDKYFKEFPYRLQIVISSELEYSNKSVQLKIEEMMKKFETTEYTQGGSIFSESWLRSFLALSQSSEEGGFDLDVTNEKKFIENLQNYYLGPSSVYSLDVKFNQDNSRIIASRFIIQSVNITNSMKEREMVTKLRQIAKEQEPFFNVTVYHPIFLFTDQFLVIKSSTIQLVSLAAVVMMIISIIFIPNPLCSIWVAFSVVSIEVGVLGFLSIWNVNLDVLSMIYLVMAIGFSVDFSAHISYAYMAAKADTPEGRLRSCLYSMGLPVVQGALSTILGVSVLIVAPSYDFLVFFKAVFLVMVIAAAHGLVFLPVILTTVGPGSCQTELTSTSVSTVDVVDSTGRYRRNDKEVY